jgi:hypothetical protein
MPSPAPRAELAGGVDDDAASAVVSATPSHGRAWWWAGFAAFLVVVVVLFDAYLHLSKTYAENSDEANILLMANDMLHGNVYLHGWNVSDVPFITTELPEIAVLVWLFGLHLNTAHIAAAVTYTLVVVIAMLLARGRTRGPKAIARMALALAIMLAPQPGIGIFVVIFSVGHIGTSAPVMLTWLVLDRFWQPPSPGEPLLDTIRRRWWLPVIIAIMLAWALMADPLVLVIAIYPLLAVCLARVVTGLITGRRNGPGLDGIRRSLAARWLEFSLALAAGLGYLIVRWARLLLHNAGGYNQQAVPFALDGGRWFMQARVAVHGLLEMFGAYFVPGQAINYYKSGTYLPGAALTGLNEAMAISRVLCVLAAIWGCCAIARRFFFRDADFVSQLLLVGIILNLAAYIPSTLADASALNVREIAPVLPFAAVLAGRMIGDRLLSGPVRSVRLPRLSNPVKVRLLVIPLVALFGWYSFGLFNQADVPAAANPYAGLEAFLEANNLTYGIGGYWDASVITVDTGGKITIRAVTPACLQPYPWESKPAWYDSTGQTANFVLLSNIKGYFNSFNASGVSLNVLNNVYDVHQRLSLNYGGYYIKRVPLTGKNGQPEKVNGHVVTHLVPIYNYQVRWFAGNLLSSFPLMYTTLNGKPADLAAPVGPANPKISCST